MGKGRSNRLVPPHGVRALVPVLAASGGAGRSTVAGLLAQVYASATRTTLIDPAPRAVSPWADWLGVGIARPEAPGVTGLADRPAGLDTASVREAATRRGIPLGKAKRSELPDGIADDPDGVGYDVLADTRPWTRPPVSVPDDPLWYARLVELGGWSAGIVDTSVPIVAAHLTARQGIRQSLLDAWMRRADTVPVLVTAAYGFGAAVLVRLIMALEQDGISAERVVVAVVNTAGTDPPRWMRTELAQLSGRVAELVEIPYDKTIRADGLARIDDVGGSTLSAVRSIAETVSNLVRHHHDEPEAEEPYAYQAVGAPAVLADPGAATGERYRGRPEPSAVPPERPAAGPLEPAPPAPPAEPEEAPADRTTQPTGWVPDRYRGGS